MSRKLPPARRYADSHYSRYYEAVAGSVAPQMMRSADTPLCPQPPSFTIGQEVFWLLILVRQMGWPLPGLLTRHLSKLANHRFRPDQVRFLLRRDYEVGVLDLPGQGAQIRDLPSDIANDLVAKAKRLGLYNFDVEGYGRWPEPDEDAETQWREAAHRFHRDDTPPVDMAVEDKVFWLALMAAQARWPMPALVTRNFPLHWTKFKMRPDRAIHLLSGKGAFDIAHAVQAGVGVRGLSAQMLEGAIDRDRFILFGEPPIPADPEVHRLRKWFSEQDFDGIDRTLFSRLAHKAHRVFLGGDEKRDDRIDLATFLELKQQAAFLKRRRSVSRPNLPAATEVQGDLPHGETRAESVVGSDAGPASDTPGSAEDQNGTETQAPHLAPMSDEPWWSSEISGAVLNTILCRRLQLPLEDQEVSIPGNWELFKPRRGQIIELLGTRRPMLLSSAFSEFGYAKLTSRDTLEGARNLTEEERKSWLSIVSQAQASAEESVVLSRNGGGEDTGFMSKLPELYIPFLKYMLELRKYSGFVLSEDRWNFDLYFDFYNGFITEDLWDIFDTTVLLISISDFELYHDNVFDIINQDPIIESFRKIYSKMGSDIKLTQDYCIDSVLKYRWKSEFSDLARQLLSRTHSANREVRLVDVTFS